MLITSHFHVQVQPPGIAISGIAEIIGEIRAEFEQLTSLVEAGLREAGEAAASGGTDSPSWRRAIEIGRAVRDIVEADARRLVEAEAEIERLLGGGPRSMP